MNKSIRVEDYLRHILVAIERIDRYTHDMDEVAFLRNELVQDAVIRNLENIGEASNNVLLVASEFAAKHNDISWKVIYAMRNRLSHAYDRVDLELVWKTVQGDLPSLHVKIQTLLDTTLR